MAKEIVDFDPNSEDILFKKPRSIGKVIIKQVENIPQTEEDLVFLDLDVKREDDESVVVVVPKGSFSADQLVEIVIREAKRASGIQMVIRPFNEKIFGKFPLDPTTNQMFRCNLKNLDKCYALKAQFPHEFGG